MCENDINTLHKKDNILIYPYTKELQKICESFQDKIIKLHATCMGKTINFSNCNSVEDILESILFPIIKKSLVDFEEKSKQVSPLFYAMNKEYEFEYKVFMKSTGFNIDDFKSYVHQLCEDGGIYRKIFKTKYLIFEFAINNNNEITIKKFHYLNVYNLVSYTEKYPVSIQVKKNTWHDIIPDSVENWYIDNKTPNKFIENITQCINQCPDMKKMEKIKSIDLINSQFDELKLKYEF